MSTSIGYGLTNFAATNLKGTSLPAPAPVTPPQSQHKTLPHALGRAATQAAQGIQEGGSNSEDKLGKALVLYAGVWDKIASARVEHDEAVKQGFLAPWQVTLTTSIAVAMKARQAVRVSRLELDAAKQGQKTASPTRQEQARLEVENAEDDLVQKTEVAITLMKTVLDNVSYALVMLLIHSELSFATYPQPEPIKNLNELTKAQLHYFTAAAEALSASQGEIEELSVAAEGEYR